MYDWRRFKGQIVHGEESLGTRLRQNGGSDTLHTISCIRLCITLRQLLPYTPLILIWGKKNSRFYCQDQWPWVPWVSCLKTWSNMLLHHEGCVYLLPVGIFSLPVVKGNMHALNEYYYVKGDPGDKVCFPKYIIKTSHGHNISMLPKSAWQS